MTTIELTKSQCEALEFRYPEEIVRAELSLGANQAASRHLDGTGLACVLYLHTPTGVRGTGAHPGHVIELSEEQLLGLGATEDAIFVAAGADTNEYALRDDPENCGCSECMHAAFSTSELVELAEGDPRRGSVCESCVQMIREGWDDRRRETAEG